MVALAEGELETTAGFNGNDIALGASILGMGLLAVAFAPEAALVGVAYGIALLGSAIVGASAGYFVGEGLR